MLNETYFIFICFVIKLPGKKDEDDIIMNALL